MNQHSRSIEERMSSEIADELDRLNRESDNPIVNHPPHYNAHPSGVECITVTEHMNFNLGNAVKYIWRAGLKSEEAITDLEKARWYVEREIARLGRASDAARVTDRSHNSSSGGLNHKDASR